MWKRSHIPGDKAFHLSETTFLLKKEEKQPRLFYHLVPVPDLRGEAQHVFLMCAVKKFDLPSCFLSFFFLIMTIVPLSRGRFAPSVNIPELQHHLSKQQQQQNPCQVPAEAESQPSSERKQRNSPCSEPLQVLRTPLIPTEPGTAPGSPWKHSGTALLQAGRDRDVHTRDAAPEESGGARPQTNPTSLSREPGSLLQAVPHTSLCSPQYEHSSINPDSTAGDFHPFPNIVSNF